MGNFYPEISDEQAKLIEESKLFFIASSGADAGPVNLSPKGATPLLILNRNKVAYLDYPGSGNETAKHIEENCPITIMVMSMGPADAAIVRLYGKGKVYKMNEECEYAEELLAHPSEHLPRPRQIIELNIERTQTSCGYGVPIYEYVGERKKDERGRKFKEPRP